MNSLNPDTTISTLNDRSTLRLHVRLAEAWIQKLADEKDFSIAVGDQYQLHHFHIKIEPGLLLIKAEIVDKPGSVIKLACQPIWEANEQKLRLEEVEIKTKSKNLLVKSAGWVASKFMQEKIDKKLEEQINHLYQTNLEKILTQPLSIPIKGHGLVNINAKALLIQKMEFEEGEIQVDVEINGVYKIELNS